MRNRKKFVPTLGVLESRRLLSDLPVSSAWANDQEWSDSTGVSGDWGSDVAPQTPEQIEADAQSEEFWGPEGPTQVSVVNPYD